MIRIDIEQAEDSYQLEISGHAEYGEPGKDIVCAGVSVIAYTMANYMLNSNNVRDAKVEEKDGGADRFCMSCKLGDRNGRGEEQAREAISAIETGLYLMRDEYPLYVKIRQHSMIKKGLHEKEGVW